MLKKIIENSYFENLIMISVFLNTFILAMDCTLTDNQSIKVMEVMNYTFTMLFTVEMGLKLLAYGINNYL